MTTFEKPVFELIEFSANDVIATSGQPGGGCVGGHCKNHCSVDCTMICGSDCREVE